MRRSGNDDRGARRESYTRSVASRPPSRRAARAAVATASLLFSLAAAEGTLRCSAPPAEVRHLLWPPGGRAVFRPAAGAIPGLPDRETVFTTNEAGLRGYPLPPADVVRILAVGGSTTECLFLDDADAWPRLLQDAVGRLSGRRVWVGNAGRSGFTSSDHLVYLRRALPEIRPDIVLVMSGANDMSACLSAGPEEAARCAARAAVAEAANEARVFRAIRPPPGPLRLLDLLRPSAVVGPTASAALAVQDTAGLFYARQRARRARARKADAPPAGLDTCLATFEATLERIAAMARADGARVVFLEQGALYRPDLAPEEEALLWGGSAGGDLFGETPPEAYHSARVLRAVLDRYNASTRGVAARLHVPCLDAADRLPRTAETYYDDLHFTPAGARRLADAVARCLVGDGLLAKRPGGGDLDRSFGEPPGN